MTKRQKWLKKIKDQTKPSYSLYECLADKTGKLLKKMTDCEEGIEDPWLRALKIGIDVVPNFGCTTDCHLMLNEMYWRSKGSHTIIIEDPDLVKMIYKAKLEVSAESLKVPYGIVAFGFPKGIVIDGIPITGCLFGEIKVSTHRSFCSDILNPLLPGPVQFVCDPKGYIAPEATGIYLISVRKENGNPLTHLRTWFDKADVDNVPSPGWVEENLKNESWLKDVEYKQQRIYFKLCYGLCMYMSAFNESLVKGFPSSISSPNQVTEYIKPSSTSTLKVVINRVGPKMHWRTWHFRTLGHERFYRNPDGTPRIILVHDTIVGAKSEVETLNHVHPYSL